MDDRLTFTPGIPGVAAATDSDLSRVIEQRLTEARRKINRIDEDIRKLSQRRQGEQKFIDAALSFLLVLNPPSESANVARAGIPAESPVATDTSESHGRQPRPVFTPGNRNENGPARKPAYETISLSEALKGLLSDGSGHGLDDLVVSIYEIESEQGRRLAKASLRSTLANGVHRGDWERQAKGIYRMRNQELGDESMN